MLVGFKKEGDPKVIYTKRTPSLEHVLARV